jgi:hypothetical protein
MPDTVVRRVSQLAKGPPELLSFKDRKGRLIAKKPRDGRIDRASEISLASAHNFRSQYMNNNIECFRLIRQAVLTQ